jgi:hypothetical protein
MGYARNKYYRILLDFMTKFVLVLYLCSTITGQCPSSSIPGWTFSNHYDCVRGGYKVAHNSFMALETLEEIDREQVEIEKLVVKFECKAVEMPKEIVPKKKPKIAT